VKIYQYEPTMFHCKVLVIDDYFSSLGSTNFDNWSFQLNDEVNLNVFDERLSSEQSRIFGEDAKRSKPVRGLEAAALVPENHELACPSVSARALGTNVYRSPHTLTFDAPTKRCMLRVPNRREVAGRSTEGCLTQPQYPLSHGVLYGRNALVAKRR
jgi:phosphatidylserine/phosphatidylglycerophosphate/cardiolipin synthase-like enzyme